jgi:hypothetical protein
MTNVTATDEHAWIKKHLNATAEPMMDMTVWALWKKEIDDCLPLQ